MEQKKTQIIIDVDLDENKVPEQISWSAKDGAFLICNQK